MADKSYIMFNDVHNRLKSKLNNLVGSQIDESRLKNLEMVLNAAKKAKLKNSKKVTDGLAAYVYDTSVLSNRAEGNRFEQNLTETINSIFGMANSDVASVMGGDLAFNGHQFTADVIKDVYKKVNAPLEKIFTIIGDGNNELY